MIEKISKKSHDQFSPYFKRLTASVKSFTRFGSTGYLASPCCLNQLPTIAPSAMASCFRQESLVEPTNSIYGADEKLASMQKGNDDLLISNMT